MADYASIKASKLEQLERKAQLFDHLRTCLGHVENGTDTTVKISQDDATRTYIMYVGNRRYWAESLDDVLTLAASDFE